MYNLAIFASGSGTNAENIINYFEKDLLIKVACVLTNRTDAYVIERAKKHKIPVVIFSREDFYQSNKIISLLQEKKIDWIILAGFLWLLPKNLIDGYSYRIINIHPALLPAYGGKGMYGSFVHEAVIKNKEPFSGITIHHVDSEYDRGDIIFQAKCKVDPSDTAETLAEKIHKLEYEHFPRVIKEAVMKTAGV